MVQLRKEPTTEVPPADDDDEESSRSSEDDLDDDDDGEDLFNIEELQKIYEEHLAGQPKEVRKEMGGRMGGDGYQQSY